MAVIAPSQYDMSATGEMVFVCEKCSKQIKFADTMSGCSCGNSLFKISWDTGGFGSTFSPDNDPRKKNPYKRKSKPGDGQGQKLTMPGSEGMGPDDEPGVGFGTKVRSKDDPRVKGDISMYGPDYEEEVKKNLEDMEETHMIDDAPPNKKTPPSTGPKPGTFEGAGQSLGVDSRMNDKEEPIGPHNMPHNGPVSSDFERLTEDKLKRYTDIYGKIRSKRLRR